MVRKSGKMLGPFDTFIRQYTKLVNIWGPFDKGFTCTIRNVTTEKGFQVEASFWLIFRKRNVIAKKSCKKTTSNCE